MFDLLIFFHLNRKRQEEYSIGINATFFVYVPLFKICMTLTKSTQYGISLNQAMNKLSKV